MALSRILLESGDVLLKQDGDALLLERSTAPSQSGGGGCRAAAGRSGGPIVGYWRDEPTLHRRGE